MRWQWFYIIFFIPMLSSCLESPDMTTGIVNGKEKPTVMTGPSVPFPDDGILLFQGEITGTGKDEKVEKGFYWSTVSNNPSSNDNKMSVSDANANAFQYELKGAAGNTTYYWRAYAENSFGRDSGEVRSYQTPPIWTPRRIFPPESRGRGGIFLLADRIYMVCGVKSPSAEAFVSDTWEYSIAPNDWSTADSISFPGEKRRYPVVFTIENRAFVGTGSLPSGIPSKDFYQFNADSRKWQEVATPDDFEARTQAVAFSLNGKGYVVGGYSANIVNLNDVWQYTYSDADGYWKKMNNFPAGFYGGISISNNSRAFVGFSDVSEFRRILYEYNEKDDSWTVFTTLPNDTKEIYSGVIIQNTIYIVDKDNIIWACDMSDETKTWKEKTRLSDVFLIDPPKIEGGFQNLLTTGNSNSIYVGLGYNKYLYEYRPLWDN